MGIERMLKMQLLGHASVKEDIKRYLLEEGAVEITDVSIENGDTEFDEMGIREMEELLEKVNASAHFLNEYSPKLSFIDRLSKGPLMTSADEIESVLGEISVEDTWKQCEELQTAIKDGRDEIVRSTELERNLLPWKDVQVAFEDLRTEDYEVQFWTVPERAADESLEDSLKGHPLIQYEECGRDGGKSYTALIVRKEESDEVGERLKAIGGYRNDFEWLEGTPAEIIESGSRRREDIASRIERAESKASELAAIKDKLLILSDHFAECIRVREVEKHFHHTMGTFLLEGWVRAVDRRRLEKGLSGRFSEFEILFRPPLEGEEPPIHLSNNLAARPYEFVTTLYGRPIYREVDPTPLLAPFFVLFFAMCMTDAGYGLTLAAVSALIMIKFKPSGGAGLLLGVLFMGGIVTAVVGVLTGGVFGIDVDSLPPIVRRFVLIEPLKDPMTMLNIAFLMGIVHMLFGMGIKMCTNLRAHLITDAIFDDLFWIVFLIALAPLGFSAVLGGDVPPGVMWWSKRVSLVMAAGIFVSGGRKEKSVFKKMFKGLIGFYDIVNYFGDVLSYARLLALGLATSAIALAVNGIAGMVKGLPYYTGYVAAVLILVLGHAFNLTVNTLGAFVHSGRLQYLEFFSKFFTGGGREFEPFRSGRRYSVLKESKSSS